MVQVVQRPLVHGRNVGSALTSRRVSREEAGDDDGLAALEELVCVREGLARDHGHLWMHGCKARVPRSIEQFMRIGLVIDGFKL